MRLLGKQKLRSLTDRHPTAKSWASSWVAEVADANWKEPSDVRVQFPRALERAPGTFAFPVAEMPVAVVLTIAFPHGIAVIEELVNRDELHGS